MCVEETVQPTEVAVPVAEPAAEAPAAAEADKPAEETPKTEEAATEDKKDEDAPKEEKPEPKAITQGTIYKTHAGLLSFFKTRRFFYFQEEAVSEADLRTYLHKDNASKATAAYALQTGKGLWFYSKDESDKTPHGIIKLADVTEVTGTGSNKFVLKLSTGDLHFEAPAVERDNWVFTLKAKIAEAKSTIEEVTKSEAYDLALEKLSNPVKPAVPAKEEALKETTEETPAEEGAKPEAPAEAVTSDTEEAADAKADMKRSASKKNKRISGFAAASFFGKKAKTEEKADEKKDEEAKPEDKVAEIPEAAAAPAPGVEPAVNEPAAEDKPAEEVAAEEKKEETRPEVPAKKGDRRSFFARFGGKKETHAEEKKEEATEETPAVAESEAAEGAALAETAAETPAEEKKDDKKIPTSPKSDLLSFFHKRDKSPAPKGAPAEDKEEETAAEAPKDEAAPATEEAPAEAAKETAANHKERRKSSFFNFGAKKAAEDVKSDSEDAEPSTAKPATSPVPKGFLGGLKRKVSKAGKTEKETKEVAAPAAVAEEEAAAPETAAAVPEESKEETTGEPAATIGDVVPAAVTVGEAKPVQAAA